MAATADNLNQDHVPIGDEAFNEICKYLTTLRQRGTKCWLQRQVQQEQNSITNLELLEQASRQAPENIKENLEVLCRIVRYCVIQMG